jgi:hypothetical protein
VEIDVVLPFAGERGDYRPGNTYRGYLGDDALAHVTADSDEEAIERLLSQTSTLTRVVLVSGDDETEVWARPAGDAEVATS